jgi:dimethylhistidine N-methyltransferase
MSNLARQTGVSAYNSDFARDVVTGLSSTPKRIPPKYFYDEEGSRLFEAITQTPEYYPTRCEIEILETQAKEIGRLVPEEAALVEFGSGSSRKVRLLLEGLPRLAAYVPVDISPEMLASEAEGLRRDRPDLMVAPVAGDFTQPFALPDVAKDAPVRVGFFPGSTLGNFEPHEASAFLRHAGQILGQNALMIIGVDLVKETAVLNAAYNDAAGVTEAFNLNLLTRINRELGGNFDRKSFEHHAFFNRERSRIEMHLASLRRQRVTVAGRAFDFRAGETIHTESSHKYTVETLNTLARGTGWTPAGAWTDSKRCFSIQAFRRSPASPPPKLGLA